MPRSPAPSATLNAPPGPCASTRSLVDAGAELVVPSRKIVPRDSRAEKELPQHNKFTGPKRGYVERCYFHKVGADRKGRTLAAVANMKKGPAALGLYARWSRRQLPWLNEWKMMGERDYVVGMEPATNAVRGRAAERASGRLIVLEPGESRHFALTLEFLPTAAAVSAAEASVARLQQGTNPEIFRQLMPDWSEAGAAD